MFSTIQLYSETKWLQKALLKEKLKRRLHKTSASGGERSNLFMAFKKEEEIIIEPRDVFVGDEDAPVTLMEFGDYESEACAKAHEVVKQLLEEYEGKIKFNFRHFPQTKIHQRSMKA